jgi:hypothetical protein
MSIQECEGYKKLVADVERDESKSPGFHNYRATLQFAVDRAEHYAEKTGLSAADILDAWESRRNYWYMNYYQDANQPLIREGVVRVFDTLEDLKTSLGKNGFRCPSCKGVSKSPYDHAAPCGWKVYGLFKIGGVTVFVKSELRQELIFMPIAWETEVAV